MFGQIGFEIHEFAMLMLSKGFDSQRDGVQLDRAGNGTVTFETI